MEDMLQAAYDAGVNVAFDNRLPAFLSGLYVSDARLIALRPGLPYEAARCVLAEELAHVHTGFCNAACCSDYFYRKQEQLAQDYAVRLLVPEDRLLAAVRTGKRTDYELAEALDVTPAFLRAACAYYARKGCNWAKTVL